MKRQAKDDRIEAFLRRQKQTGTAPDGTGFGDPIPGSAFFRSFCPGCGAPMRAQRKNILEADFPWCEDCSPKRPPPAHTALTPAQRHDLSKTDGG